MYFLKSYFILSIPAEIIKGIETGEAILCHNLGKKRKHNILHFLGWEMGPKMP